MKHYTTIWHSKTLLLIIPMAMIAVTSLMAQTTNPKGLYRLTEIVHQDGKHLEAGYKQYKYCQDNLALTLTYIPNVFKNQPFNFSVSNPDGKPLRLTGELSKTENKGTQVIGTSDSTFTLRWYNDRSGIDERLFPSQTNIDEQYELVKDTTDAIQRSLNLLQMNFGAGSHRLQGVWKLRGVQQSGNATSQYWIVKNGPETYQILGSHEAVTVVANADFPSANLQCQFTPCTYLSENAFDFAGQTFIVNWFDGETISVTGINDAGRPFVTVWDRCGLPQNIQDVFGTRIPPMKKDISRFFTNEFMKKYGAQPDSIRLAFETFDFAVDANERNNAIFPVLMRNGFESEYISMKDTLLARLMRGEINADEAVGRYVFWFNKNFDRHTNCSSQFFRQLKSESFIDYTTLIPQYHPEPVGCKVDNDTYLLRLPSCAGDLPTWEWMLKKEEEFKQSGCKYLILDLRGNSGGSDAFSELFAKMMCDCSAMNDEQSYYMNSTANNNALKKYCETFPGTFMDRVLAETSTAEEGSLINWNTVLKGTDAYTPLVRKGAIIIDNYSASAGETPVRLVRNHSKSHATVYGKERTAGCELSGNCNTIRLPHSSIFFTYPMTVDAEFEKACRERNPGHKPDVIIPLPYPKQLTDNIDPWVLWVAKKMKK